MDSMNIKKSIISISSPGTHLVAGDDKIGQKTTRDANEYMASLCKQHPDRFGFFAALPNPDIQGSLDEIDYALDTLGAVGFGLVTNLHGMYLGDPKLAPVYEKLNTKKAVIFIHPTNCHLAPIDGSTPQIVAPLAGIPPGMLEYLFETTRTVTSLLLSGTAARNPDIKFIIPHCGATLSVVLERIAGFAKSAKVPGALTSAEMKAIFKKQFYFDLAGFPFPDQLPAMMNITSPDRLLYGTDYPYLFPPVLKELAEIMDEGLKKMFDEETVGNIYVGNATDLLKGKGPFSSS